MTTSSQISVGGYNCVSPAMTTGLWVTMINAASVSTGLGQEGSCIPGTMKIRTNINNGALITFNDLASTHGHTVPTGNSPITVDFVLEGDEIDVKRVGCLCTRLNKFKMNNNGLSANMTELETEDGFQFAIGENFHTLAVTPAGFGVYQFKNLSLGDLLIRCDSYGEGPAQISSSCIAVVDITHNANFSAASFAYQPETAWPQDEYPTSECRSIFMAENGIYIIAIPDGGDY